MHNAQHNVLVKNIIWLDLRSRANRQGAGSEQWCLLTHARQAVIMLTLPLRAA
jgi:hypothetical protein